MCHLDTIPSRLFKEVFDTIGPHVLTIINTSLLPGTVPLDFKRAIVHPLLKKLTLTQLLSQILDRSLNFLFSLKF